MQCIAKQSKTKKTRQTKQEKQKNNKQSKQAKKRQEKTEKGKRTQSYAAAKENAIRTNAPSQLSNFKRNKNKET